MPKLRTESVPSSPLSRQIQQKGIRQPQEGSVWLGPCLPGWNGGVTQGMIADFLRCRETFRVKYVLGLQPAEKWNHHFGYGNMWHVCEQELANPSLGHLTDKMQKLYREHCDAAGMKLEGMSPSLFIKLREHAEEQQQLYPLQQEEIAKWYNVCKVQFPLYVDWWAKHPDVRARTPLLSEQVFDVLYPLPSGRIVRLRGKWDSVDLVDGHIWLQENKSKSAPDRTTIQQQLTFDLQTMLYIVALKIAVRTRMHGMKGLPIRGVRYNVIRRPLSGGQGSIVQGKCTKGAKCSRCKGELPKIKKCTKCGGRGRIGGRSAETFDAYMKRLGDVIRNAKGIEWGVAPDEHFFFHRWNVDITELDIKNFEQQFLIPFLEQMCQWFEFIEFCNTTKMNLWGGTFQDGPPIHWRNPYGVHYSLDGGGATEWDSFITTGSTVGLKRQDTLFPELKDAAGATTSANGQQASE